MELRSVSSYKLFATYGVPTMQSAIDSALKVDHQNYFASRLHLTLSVWPSKEASLRYVVGPLHKGAIAIKDQIGRDGRVYGYETDTIPTWDEAYYLLEKHGRNTIGSMTDVRERVRRAKARRVKIMIALVVLLVLLVSALMQKKRGSKQEL